MNATKRGIAWIVAACLPMLVVTATALPGCSQAPAQSKLDSKPPSAVTVSRAVNQEVIDFEEFTGRIDAANKVGIQAMVTGYLQKINFKDGEDAKKDDVLFVIDPSIFQAKVNLATAAVAQAKAKHDRLQGDYDRNYNLQGVAVSREEFKKIEGDMLEAKAAVGMTKAQLDEAEVNLKYTVVKSPINGRTSRRLIDVGNMVKANETMLTWVYQVDPMYGYFDVDEKTVTKLRRLIIEGQIKSYREGKLTVEVGLTDEEGYSMSGVIDWVDSVFDGGTGTSKMRAVISQPRNSSTDQPYILVSPGMFIRVKLPTSVPHNALLVAEKAVATDQGEKFLLIVNDQKKIERRPVKVGQMHKGLRVVENATSDRSKDLKPTDLIVISGLQRVKSGDEVSFAEPVPMPRAGTSGQGAVLENQVSGVRNQGPDVREQESGAKGASSEKNKSKSGK